MSSRLLKKTTNQALKLAEYGKEFMKSGKPSIDVLERTKLFHTDSVLCGISALALKTNAPSVLKAEALLSKKKSSMGERAQKNYAKCFGSNHLVLDTKAIVANCSAVREWDSNGTVFGYRVNQPDFQAGEFGHNDFYPVVIAAAYQNSKINGNRALKAMILIDEIRCRLAESFSLKTYKIDHVVHGAIASIVTYGVLLDASPDQIEQAIGMFVAHYIPFRAIRAGHQLSDSKGASAAISTEAAIMCLKRTMMGFVGPRDIFRNPEAIFRYFTKTEEFESPFDILLGFKGDDFAIMGNHFKLGLYEHQSAGALQGLLNIILNSKFIEQGNFDKISNIKIVIYEPAYGIICDPHKKNPTTRQSADHSMLYILSTLLKKAVQHPKLYENVDNTDDLWKKLILLPEDYNYSAINDVNTRSLMEKISLEHGGSLYDNKYPEGIPTTIKITTSDGNEYDSGLVMFPSGHARNTEADLKSILKNKFNKLGTLALQEDNLEEIMDNLNNLDNLTNSQVKNLYNCNINYHDQCIDDPDY